MVEGRCNLEARKPCRTLIMTLARTVNSRPILRRLASPLEDVAKLYLCTPKVHGIELLDAHVNELTTMLQQVKALERAAAARRRTLQFSGTNHK